MNKKQKIRSAIVVLEAQPIGNLTRGKLIDFYYEREDDHPRNPVLRPNCGCALGVLAKEAGATPKERFTYRYSAPDPKEPPFAAIQDRFGLGKTEQLVVQRLFDHAGTVQVGLDAAGVYLRAISE